MQDNFDSHIHVLWYAKSLNDIFSNFYNFLFLYYLYHSIRSDTFQTLQKMVRGLKFGI